MEAIKQTHNNGNIAPKGLRTCLQVFLLVLVLNGPFTSSFAQDLPPKLDEGQQAFNDGQFQQAFELLKAQEENQAGVIEFDYLFGRAALETGDLNTAIAALSRVLSLDPAFAGARLELARTYYSKGVKEHSRGSFEQARAEFNNVLNQKPPGHIAKSIKEYLVVIDKYLEVRHLDTHVFVELSTGFDSNVNSGTSADYFSFFDVWTAQYREVLLAQEANRKEASFFGVKVGAEIVLPLFSRYFDLFGTFQAGSNMYGSANKYNHDTFRGEIGAHHYGESNKKTLSMNFNDIDVDGQRYADEFFGKFEWAQRLDEDNMLTGRLVGGDLNYENELWVRSVNGGRLMLEWTHLTRSTGQTSYQLLFLQGHDGEQKCDSFCLSMYSRDISGLRLAVGTNVFSQTRLYSSIYMEFSDYEERFFDHQRFDERLELFLGMSTRLSKTWHIRPELQYIYNDSNIDLFSYKRVTATINLRWGI